MNEQMQQELLNRLDALAAKLGTTAEHLWGVLIYQARIDALVSAIGFVVFGLITMFLYKVVRNADDEIDRIFPAVGMVITFGIAIACLFSIWTPLLNPEYFALQKVLEVLK